MSSDIEREDILHDLREFFEMEGHTKQSYYYNEWEGYSNTLINSRFGGWGEAIDEAELPHDHSECDECGKLVKNFGKHWNWNPDCRPRITDRQRRIIDGLIMGDGSVSKGSKDSLIEVKMVSKRFLEWLNSEFGRFGSKVNLHKTAEEQAQMNRKSGQSPHAHPDNYRTVYRLRSRTHPKFNKYRQKWYPNGEKRYPDDLELTPLTLNVWYCCDGNISYSETRNRPRLRISCTNEIKRESYITDLFDKIEVKPWFGKSYLTFSCDYSEVLWDYMEKPLPGFEYKWPDE